MKSKSTLTQEVWNPPNLITLARIALIPFFMVLLMMESRRNSFWASILFGLAAGTDFLDGYLARKLKLITTFGKFIDPLADKLITMGAYVGLVQLARLPAWVVVVILARELIISGLRTIAISEGIVIAASQGGKWKTALQLVGIIALLVWYPYRIDFLFFETELNFAVIGLWITYLSLIPSLVSAADYFRGFLAGIDDSPEDGPMSRVDAD